MPTSDGNGARPEIDVTKPHPARVYDWMLGGKDNYLVDEELARQMLAFDPSIPLMARANRAFMHRSTRWLAEQGVRQFLDIGTGIPTEPNLHQIAQSVAPDARIVYCDNDPIVLAHADALMRGTAEGALEFVRADAREIDTVFHEAAKTLDFDRPMAVSLIALLHFVTDEGDADHLVNRVKEILSPGSYLVLSHVTADFHAEEDVRRAKEVAKSRGYNAALRTRDRIERFFDGLGLVDPGLVLAEDWHPEPDGTNAHRGNLNSSTYVGVARRA
ncbi:hypothetical protein SRB5_25530 [Streptomyces sp. RB5]|uniref:Methyltransferase n=1 Tax=Streptomyces smaragdinus TaxID=2585196 RepID=A0A7K0CG15_9ACTN|nr:SAM-dependent methyltransferase [Streptomyces smaragdinus]MQY12419.1 hypothetical protein [Streptomyces smaragdinus]